MMLRVLLFGKLGDIAGWTQRAVDPFPTLSALRDHLGLDDPTLGEALTGRGVQTAVNLVIVRGEVALPPDAEVAFLPPMSGG